MFAIALSTEDTIASASSAQGLRPNDARKSALAAQEDGSFGDGEKERTISSRAARMMSSSCVGGREVRLVSTERRTGVFYEHQEAACSEVGVHFACNARTPNEDLALSMQCSQGSLVDRRRCYTSAHPITTTHTHARPPGVVFLCCPLSLCLQAPARSRFLKHALNSPLK